MIIHGSEKLVRGMLQWNSYVNERCQFGFEHNESIHFKVVIWLFFYFFPSFASRDYICYQFDVKNSSSRVIAMDKPWLTQRVPRKERALQALGMHIFLFLWIIVQQMTVISIRQGWQRWRRNWCKTVFYQSFFHPQLSFIAHPRSVQISLTSVGCCFLDQTFVHSKYQMCTHYCANLSMFVCWGFGQL
jgi:hypothetical protein